jgi:flagellar hook-associated protein 2
VTLEATRPAVVFGSLLQPAQDAQFKVNGLSVTRGSNTISDVIDGVTLNLQSVSNGAARLDLTRETSSIKDNIKALVTAYNDFNGNLNILGDRSSEVETFGGSLAGDSLLNSVRSQVRSMLTANSSTASGSIQAARNVGLSIDRNGVLQLDEAKLDQALQNNFSDVVKMFTANTNNLSVYSTANAGLAGDAVRKLDQMLRSTGLIAQQTNNAQKHIETYKAELLKLQDRMDQLLTRYTNQFSVMESIVGESNSMRTSLKNTFAAMSSSNN